MLDEIKQKICSALVDAEVLLASSDLIHFEATIISDQFIGLKSIDRQRLINDILAVDLLSGKIHALSLKTSTQDEWQKKCKN
jgi:acid stress-induced BolA-like protein IbaG/YrbA